MNQIVLLFLFTLSFLQEGGFGCPAGTWGISPCLPCMSQCATCSISTQCNSCKPGYYYVSSGFGQCPNCSTVCKTCTSSSTQCTSCNDGYYLSGTSCPACQSPCSKCITTNSNCTDCVNGFYLSGSTCVSCSKPCAQCTSSPTNCTVCVDTANQSIPNCDCIQPNKYMDTITYMCNNCVSPCQNCSSAIICDSCVNGYVLSGHTCLPCTKPCANCITNQTICSTCMDSLNQIPSSCNCNSGFIMNSSTYMCDQCNHPCFTCQNSINECHACFSSYQYDSTAHTCTCLTNQYEDNGSPKQCQNCQSPCLTCSSFTDCNSCVIGLNRHLQGNSCICDDGYYDDAGICTLCPLSCTKCTSATICTECKHLSHQVLNDCHCIDTYYMNASYMCQSCVSPCVNCSSGSVCTSCINNYYLASPNCLQCTLPCYNCVDLNTKCTSCAHPLQTVISNQCICNDGYYMDTSYYCQSCTHPCSKCTTTSTYCTDCANTYILSGSNTCVCADGFYEEIGNNPSNCQICTSPCSKCVITSTHCVTCIDTHQTVNTTTYQCLCNIGWVANGNYCDQCVNPCRECTGITTYCTNCKDIHHQPTSGQCICEYGWVNDANYDCQPCLTPCSSCSINITHCNSCTDPNHIINASYQCICQDTYYSDTISHCAPCQQPCAKCDSNGCLTCIDINQSVDSNLDCVCNNGYYMDSVNCLPCQLPCVYCTSSLDCLTCIDINQTINNDRCVCNNGYFLNGNYCNLCQLPCTKCVTSQDTCTECVDSNHILINNKCICKPGYGQSSLNVNYCSMCQYPCLECSLTVKTCTKCIDSSLFKIENNECICQQGYYMQNNQCQRCAPQCRTCEYYEDNCLNCKDITFIQFDNQCFCDFGYYLDFSFQCKLCKAPCTTCQYFNSFCTSCIEEYQNLINHKCICQDGYYMQYDKCQKCYSTCTKCFSLQICNECIDGYYLSNDICQKCEIQCSTCIKHEVCLSCADGYYMDTLHQCNTCISNCKECDNAFTCLECIDGFFINEEQCLKCDDNCQTCIDEYQKCQSCNNNFQLINNKCICQIGYYYQNYKCLQCDYPCIKCENQYKCDQCIMISNIILNKDNKCVCQDGYFWLENVCQVCDDNCQTCDQNSQNCLSCKQESNQVLYKNKCQCASNYFLNQFNVCQNCKSEDGKVIKSCKYVNCGDSQWTYGEECDDGNNINRDGCSNCIIDKNHSCINNLLDRSICFQCSQNCILCEHDALQKQIVCKKCQSGYFLDKNQCNKCNDKCKECIDSSSNCQTCRIVQKDNNECKLCESNGGYYTDFYNNLCFTKCGDGIKSKDEECDDGNLIDFDGCNKICKNENNYICQMGICSYVQLTPVPKLKTYGDNSIYNPIRLFQLTYNLDLDLPINFNLSEFLQLELYQNFKSYNINYEYKIIQQLEKSNQNKTQISAIIQLTLNRSSENEFLQLLFNNLSLFSSNGQVQQVSQINEQISKFIIIEQSMIQQVELINSGNYYILYILAGFAGGSILFGGVDFFYNLLDTLQMLSYLKYINTQFPYNLEQFFQLFGFAQLNFISKYFDIQGLIDPYINYEQLKSIPQKIQNDGYNSLFIINGTSLLTIWLSFLFIYSTALIFPLILRQFQMKYFSETPDKDKYLLKFKLYILSLKIFVGELCYIIISEFIFSGMIRTHISTAYDLTFSMILQISALELKSEDDLVKMSSVLSLIALAIYLLIIYAITNIAQLSNLSITQKNIQQRYGSVFEGLSLTQYCKYTNAILLFKKLVFMILLIFTYENPLYQSINLAFLSLIQSLLIYQFKPFNDQNEYKKQLSCEINISITLFLISILIIDKDLNFFTEDDRTNLGWCCIICICFILVIQLVLDIYQQWKLVIKKYRKIKRLIEKINKLFFSQSKQYASHTPLSMVH
ncbi:unnamed protein product [Paramecium sonneborni]|uniref:EGF-like domain-containing protein n=1 Tax=Paramecium sonneborni TaxID=65129 RepID=A0A8S1PX22_9CILI|nr:unnamed protein product [Paramecium sonneborni]